MLFAGWEEGGSTSKCCRHGGARKESGKYANCQLKVWRKDDEDFTTFLKCGELCKLSRFAENGRNVETIIIMSQINFDKFLKSGKRENMQVTNVILIKNTPRLEKMYSKLYL